MRSSGPCGRKFPVQSCVAARTTASLRRRTQGNHMRIILSILVAIVLSGCASVGENFQDGNLNRLQPGITTEQQAISLLGAKPIARKFEADGSSILKWEYVHGNGFTRPRAKMVEAMFSKDHKFVRLVKSANVGSK